MPEIDEIEESSQDEAADLPQIKKQTGPPVGSVMFVAISLVFVPIYLSMYQKAIMQIQFKIEFYSF